MYKYYYDEKTKKIDFIQFNDLDNIPETNFVLNSYDENYNFITKYCEHMNKYISDGYWKLLKCKDCGKYFILQYDEELWFTERGLSAPKRCHKCRAKRRQG